MSLQRPPHRLVATVLGAGTMGAQIAAHLANAGVRTHLLDIVPSGVPADAPPAQRNAVAAGALAALRKARPAPFMSERFASRIEPGNLDDHLESAVAKSDLVIEAVVERLDVKRSLFDRIAKAAPQDTILATNTSGIPIASIASPLPPHVRGRVVGMHFFNPPRYMHLLEIVSSEFTDPEVAEVLARFSERVLGKGVVRCPDTPNFIGNRIGIAEMALTFRAALEGGYTVEEVDFLNGKLMGRPKTGSFRLADLVGIDVATLVMGNLARTTSGDPGSPEYDELHALMVVPPVFEAMFAKGIKGDKTGQGFYKKTSKRDAQGNREVLSLDLSTLAYRPRVEPSFPELATIAKIPDLEQRVHAALRAPGRGGDFLRRVYLPLFDYAAARLGQVSREPRPIDDAMRWGYGWQLGPFALFDAAGVRWVAEQLARVPGHRLSAATQALLEHGGDEPTWYGGRAGARTTFVPAEKRHQPLPRREGFLFLADRREAGAVLDGDETSTLLDLGDGIACLEFHSKMNSLSEPIIHALARAVPTVLQRGGFRGLVIGNQGENFSAGADIAMILASAAEKKWNAIESTVASLQRAVMSLRHAEIPVVTAPFGMTLGGGCEVALHGAAAVAGAETYMGLVEIGVGLLPAGGGLKEIVRRAAEWARMVPEGDPYPWLRRGFEATTTAKVSASAHEAVELGYLRPSDPIVFHRDLVLARAKQQAIALAEAGWVPPDPDEAIDVIGASRGASFLMGAQLFAWGGFASQHDKLIAEKIAHVLSGGMQIIPRPVNAAHLLDLEREAFVSLCGEPKTQQRLESMLKTKKPLRN